MLEEKYQQAVEFWDMLVLYFPPLQAIKGRGGVEGVARFRNQTDGGHLLFRPVGLLMIGKVIQLLLMSEVSLQAAVKRIAKVPMKLHEEPWIGLLWDSINHRMIGTPENQSVARKLLLYMVGGDLSTVRSSEELLRMELSGAINRPESSVQLPPVVTIKRGR